MDWNTYRQVYLSFEVSINQSEIIAQASTDVLKNYPHDLPPKVRTQLAGGVGHVRNMLKDALQRLEHTAEEAEVLDTAEPPEHGKGGGRQVHTELLEPTLMIAIYNLLSGRELFDVDFAQVIYSQQLAIAFAHFDAFLGDTLRAILRVNPNILRKNKQITWDTIIELGSWERVIEHLSETLVYDFGWLSAVEKVTFFREEFGFDLQLTEDETAVITEGELLRHLILHNGGRVSAEHLRRTNSKNLKIGEQISIDHAHIHKVCFALRKAASNLFVLVSESFFKKKESELALSGIPRFSTKGDQST